MGIALLLQQRCVFALLARRRARSPHARQIKRGGVGAPHEAHEVRRRKQGATVEIARSKRSQSRSCFTCLGED